MSTTAQIKNWSISHKTQLIIAGVVLVLLIAAFIYVYHKGKSTTSIAPIVKDTPGSNDPNNNPAGTSDSEIKMLAGKLFSDMDGVNVWSHDEEPYQQLLTLSDTDFEKVYNEFNADHQASSGQTLRQWIDNEDAYWGSQFSVLKESILNRMDKLNLI